MGPSQPQANQSKQQTSSERSNTTTSSSNVESEIRANSIAMEMRKTLESMSTSVMSDQLRGILMMPATERSKEQHLQVYAGLVSLQVFARIPECTESVAKELSRVVTLRKILEEGTDVFRQGDPGDAFYVVATGSIKIWISDANNRPCVLVTRTAGDVFGEVALVTDAPRTATCTTSGPNTELLVISKADYLKILRPAREKELLEKTLLLSKIPLFEGLSSQEIGTMAEKMPKRRFRAGEVLAKQGDPANEAYIIFKGTLSVIGNFRVPQESLREMEFEYVPGAGGHLDLSVTKRDRARIDKLLSAEHRPRLHSMAAGNARKSDMVSVSIHLRDLWKGDMVGELGLIVRSERSASIISSTAADVFVVNKADMLKYFPPTVIDRLQERANQSYAGPSMLPKDILKQQGWITYKKCITSIVVNPQAPLPKPENTILKMAKANSNIVSRSSQGSRKPTLNGKSASQIANGQVEQKLVSAVQALQPRKKRVESGAAKPQRNVRRSSKVSA